MGFDVGVAAHPAVAVLAALHAGALAASLPPALRRRRVGNWILGAALAFNAALITWNWVSAGRPPFKTLFETLVFYPLCVSAVTLVLIRLHGLHVLTPFSAAVCLGGLGYALCRPDTEVVNLPPALQSGWFVPHVVTYFVSYATLFASAVLALIALVRRSEAFEGHAHGAAVFGIATLTAGLVMGGIWGKYAWGDYWSWDPKENWALVTWLAYLLYLHLRLMDGWQGRRAMVLLVVAFGAVVFTYLGVHLLPTGKESLHVYQ